MTPITVYVPPITDSAYGFDALFQLWPQVNGHGLDVTFDFSQCYFLAQNAVAFLGGLGRLIEHRDGRARFAWDTLAQDVLKNLAQQGFLAAFGHPQGPWVGNSIPYREDRESEESTLADYLKAKWLGRGWVNISDALRDAIVGVVWEIYANAFEHGRSPIGLFSCGQHFPRKHRLCLTVVDFGVGIPWNVRQFLRSVAPKFQEAVNQGRAPPDALQLVSNCPADVAMMWAFRPGTTTKPNGMGRGMGLDLLKQFVKLNKGRLEVFSHEGYTLVSNRKEDYDTRAVFFEGTLVNISLACDNTHYTLATKAPKGPLF